MTTSRAFIEPVRNNALKMYYFGNVLERAVHQNNLGMLKHLSGNDTFYARALYDQLEQKQRKNLTSLIYFYYLRCKFMHKRQMMDICDEIILKPPCSYYVGGIVYHSFMNELDQENIN